MIIKHNQTTVVDTLPLHLTFIADSQDVEAIKEHIGAEADDYDSFFVATHDGDYTEVWGMCGIVPLLSKMVSRLV